MMFVILDTQNEQAILEQKPVDEKVSRLVEGHKVVLFFEINEQ